MTKILTIAISVLLISCSSDNNTTPVPEGGGVSLSNCPTNSSYDANVQPGNIQLTVIDRTTYLVIKDVKVQLGNNGKCIKTDENGHVKFSKLSAGTYDIHIFGPIGMRWQSYYNIPVSGTEGIQLQDSVLYKNNPASPVAPEYPTNSYNYYGGVITGTNPLNTSNHLYLSDQESFRCDSVISGGSGGIPQTYKAKCYISSVINTPVENEFWFFESKRDPVSNDLSLINAYSTKKFNTKTVSEKNSSSIVRVTNNIPFSSAVNATTLLMSFDSFNLPTGFVLKRLEVHGDIKPYVASVGLKPIPSRFYDFNRVELYAKMLDNLVANPSFSSYVPLLFNFTDTELTVETKSGGTNDYAWSLKSRYPLNSTGLSFTPKLSPSPSLNNDQQGGVITWNSNTALTKQSIELSNSSTKNTGDETVTWNVEIFGNTNTITLPVIPKHVTPIFTEGTLYSISLSGEASYPVPNGVGNAVESFSHFNVTWIR